MLTNVHLKNLALIKEAEIDYKKGLNIMTGETGSGKSIIISSINIALGEKANKGLIRTGAEHALVELTFTTDDRSVHELLKEMDIPEDGNNITVKRRITPDSGISKVNGETVTLASLKKITSLLVDIHGQHDHQSLLNPLNHIDILDRFGGFQLNNAKKGFQDLYHEYRSLKTEFSNFSMDREALEREMSLLEHEHREIEEAALVKDEDSALEEEFRQLESWEKTSESLSSAFSYLTEEENGAASSIARAFADLAQAAAFDSNNTQISSFNSSITDIDSLVKDLSHDLGRYIEERKLNQERLYQVRERLNLINRLKSRYGRTLEDISEYDLSLTEKLEKFRGYIENREEISARLTGLRSALNNSASKLSEIRKNAAIKLESEIAANLSELNFLNVDFCIDISKNDRIGSKGFDRVEFTISLNPGEARKPLAKVASGGELSRIMLAIKCAIAENDSIPTLIFDEIDTGISGKTAQMVAEKLKTLGRTHQIICITHLPQIAAMADTHFSIHKSVEDGLTISGIEQLDDERDIEEIARLLSGETITPVAIENARELKKLATE